MPRSHPATLTTSLHKPLLHCFYPTIVTSHEYLPPTFDIFLSTEAALLTPDSEGDGGGHVGRGGHLALVLARVPGADVPDDEGPAAAPLLPPGILPLCLQPQVGGVGVAAHRQQGDV